jgi:Tfp pilus assembly protein PilN
MKPASSRGKRVYVEVSPSRLEVALVNGASVSSLSEAHATADWAAQWPSCLSALDGALAGMVERLGAAGCPATVVYTCQSATVSVFACPAAGGRRAAEQAARLGLAGLCTFSTDENPCEVFPVYTDSGTAGAAPQIHSIGMADLDGSLEALMRWARSAGLEPDRFVPAEAAAMMGAVQAADHEGGPDDAVRAALFFGDHTSVLAAAHRGRLCFVRGLSIGTDALVEALTRPIRVGPGRDGAPRPPVSLDRAAAREMLLTVGVPALEDRVDDDLGIDGSSILPLLQPALQRISVELKQSFRFGVDEAAAKAAVSLAVVGPGGSIPRMGGSIARLCGAAAVDLPGWSGTGGEARASASVGLVAVLRRPGAPEAGLVPRAMEKARTLRTFRRGMWAGIAACAGLVAWDAQQARATLGKERARLEQLKRQVASASNSTPAQEQAQAALDRLAAFEAKIGEQMGEWVDWSVVLRLLAEHTPERVRLTGVEMTGAGAASCRMSGYVESASTTESASIIGRYMSALGTSPLVRTVDLGTTQHTQRDGRGVQQFELSVHLIGLPAHAQAAVKDAGLARAGEAGAP